MKQSTKQKAIFPFILMLFSIIITLCICYYNINSNINKVDFNINKVDAFLTDLKKETKEDFEKSRKETKEDLKELKKDLK